MPWRRQLHVGIDVHLGQREPMPPLGLTELVPGRFAQMAALAREHLDAPVLAPSRLPAAPP